MFERRTLIVLVLLSGLVLALPVQAATNYWNAQGVNLSIADKLFVDVTNSRIGIGTTNPAEHLVITGGAAEALRINGTSSGNIYLENAGANAHAYRIGTHTGVGTGGFFIQDINASAGDPIRMFIATSGNVGIGTTSPDHLLHLAKSGNTPIAFDSYSTTDAHNPYLEFRKSNSDTIGTLAETADGEVLGQVSFWGVDNTNALSQAAAIRVTQNGAAGVEVPGKFQILTGTSAASLTERLTIDNQGYVGIGTISPAEKLEINGSLRITGGGTGSNNLPSDTTFIIGTGGKSFNFLNADENGVNGIIGTWNTVYNTQDAKIVFSGSSGHQGDISFHTFGTAVLNEVMRITSTGKVGIGTTSPTQKLDVNGTANVAGNVNVTGSGNISLNAVNQQIQFGPQNNASIYWNGTGLIIKVN